MKKASLRVLSSVALLALPLAVGSAFADEKKPHEKRA